MGMDAYIVAAHSKKEIENSNFWSSFPKNITEDEKWTTIGEKWHARRFWELHNNLISTCFNNEYECGEWIELTRENIEAMIQFAIHNPDYWNGFNSVPNLCEILYHWEEAEEAGLHFYYECYYECDW